MYRLVSTEQYARHAGSCRCFLHPCNSFFFNWNSTNAKIAKKIAACKQPKKNAFDAIQGDFFLLKSLATWVSIEKLYFPWMCVVIWLSMFFPVAPLSPHWDWSDLVELLLNVSSYYQLRICRSTKCADQGAQKFILLQLCIYFSSGSNVSTLKLVWFVRVIAGINSESAKGQDVLIKELKSL